MGQDGSVFLAGRSETFSDALNSKRWKTWAVVKLDAEGSQLWRWEVKRRSPMLYQLTPMAAWCRHLSPPLCP